MRAYERLLKYVTYPTASDETSKSCPSTPEQLELGRALVQEMKELGIADAAMDENGYVYGTVPGNVDKKVPVVGFIAHMDVVRDVPFDNIRARVHHYDGGDIMLNEEQGIVMSPDEFPELKNYAGGDLIVTDGTTLLGADDKAGIAEIMTMAERLLRDPSIRHGDIKLGFTPDEEIGRGADLFDIPRFGADFAYTVDGAAFGAVEYENFNAASCKVSIRGKNIHPGSSKNKMKNALLIAAEFSALLPPAETPTHTEMREGFYHLTSVEGVVEQAEMRYILRDHDSAVLEERKKTMQRAADFLNARYGEGTVTLTLTDGYRNMAEAMRDHMHIIETARSAVRELGSEPQSNPIRGGTDGARLTYMGLICPNLGTGSHNHHGKLEYASVQAMDKCTDLLVKITEAYAR